MADKIWTAPQSKARFTVTSHSVIGGTSWLAWDLDRKFLVSGFTTKTGADFADEVREAVDYALGYHTEAKS
jgi:hypothetical protein